MQLIYIPIQNFGDQLNPWIWKQLLGDRLDINEDNCSPNSISSGVNLLSIGSYLNSNFLERFTSESKAIIAGTGCGYGMMSTPYSWGLNFPYQTKILSKLSVASPQKKYTDSKRFYWVRGPLTAHLLGLPKETAIADGAYLLRKVLPKNTTSKRDGVAFMPHISSAQLSPWQEVCDQIGFKYIDPRESLPSVINGITQAEVLVTDALHGAIVSDALRTPWIPVKTSQCILDFKWIDHCSAIRLNYQPINIPTIWSPSAIMKSQRSLPKKIIFGARTNISNWLINKEKVTKALFYAGYSQPYLSSEEVINSIDEKLEYLVDQIKTDMEKNSFFNKNMPSALKN